MLLAEKIDEWTAQWKQEGFEEAYEKAFKEGFEQGLNKGLEQGRQEGRQQEAASMLLRFLVRRFGDIDEATRQRVQDAPVEQIEAWSDRVLDVETLSDVFAPANQPSR